MTVEELLARCELVRASEKRLTECQPFSCGESDLDEFFAKDCLVNQSRLLGKTYLFCLKDQPETIVTAFSLSSSESKAIIASALPSRDGGRLYVKRMADFFGHSWTSQATSSITNDLITLSLSLSGTHLQ